MSQKRMAGHTFLAKLGKKRLRPGGIKATQFLMDAGHFNHTSQVLEVACNQGTSAIELVKKYGVELTAIDLDEQALEIAKTNAINKGVSEKIEFLLADARELPFADNTFDVVINEAMLTMLTQSDKEKAIREYHRVLKPGGVLLTHDVMLRTTDEAGQSKTKQEVSRAIFVNVQPFDRDGWKNLFETNGYQVQGIMSGPMSLMDPIGMIRDEGFVGTIQLVARGMRSENRKQFKTMFNTFKANAETLGFIAVVSKKVSE